MWGACHLTQLRAGAHCTRSSAGRARRQCCPGLGDPVRCLCQLVDAGEPLTCHADEVAAVVGLSACTERSGPPLLQGTPAIVAALSCLP